MEVKQQEKQQIIVNIESAFGRPAKWTTALPAVAVGCLALIIAMYGRWSLPPQLPENYRAHLEQSEADYLAAKKLSGVFGNTRFVDLAGERDVIFGRLASLEKGSPQRYWEWAMFLIDHANETRARINDPAASIQKQLQERMQAQVGLFENKSRDILEQLAVSDSPLRAKALLRVTRDKYRSGLAFYGVPKALELADALAEVLTPATNSDPAEAEEPLLTPEERGEAQLLMVQLKTEGAWQANAARRLLCDQAQIDQARQLLSTLPQDERSLEWTAMRQLLDAYSDGTQASQGETPNFSSLDNPTWEQRQAAIQTSCLSGQWNEVDYLLAGFQLEEDPALTIGACRTICRLAVSPLAHLRPEWSQDINSALMLVAQRGSHLPEFAELMWECVEWQLANSAEDQASAPTTAIAPDVVRNLAHGNNPLFRQSVAVLSAAIQGETEAVARELELLQPGHGSCFIISRTVLWRNQVLSPEVIDAEELQHLSRLLSLVAEREPQSGLNWIALASLQLRTGQADAALNSLEQAEKLLGSVSLISEMKKAARSTTE